MKKVMCVVALFALLACSAQASVAVNGSVSALISDDGQEILAPNAFADIEKVKDGVFAAKSLENGLYALFDGEGNRKTEFAYRYFSEIGDGILFEKDGRYGVMDSAYEIRVPNEYTWIVDNGAGGYLALRTDVWDNTPDGVYKIDETGYVSPTGVKVALYLMDFNEGLSPALSTYNGRYGYLNSDGQWAISPQYAYADSFHDGFAVAMLDSGRGVIDTKGKWLITPKFDYISIGRDSGDMIAGVDFDSGVTMYSPETFEECYSMHVNAEQAYVVPCGGNMIVYNAGSVQLMGSDGAEILSVGAEGYMYPVSNRRMIVYDANGAYVADEYGNQLIQGYQELDELCAIDGKICYLFAVGESESLASLRLGVVDDAGRELVKGEYTGISVPEQGCFLAENETGAYLIKSDGTLLWKYEY